MPEGVQAEGPSVDDTAGPGTQAESLSTSWPGIDFTGITPASVEIGVGLDEVVLVANSRISIRTKCGRELFGSDLGEWFGDPGGLYRSPKVVYDPWRGRWLVSSVFLDRAALRSELVLAASAQTSAMGQYRLYRFDINIGDPGKLIQGKDYDLGYSSSVVTAAGDQYMEDLSWHAGVLRWWNPGEIYNGTAATMRSVSVSRSPRPCRALAAGETKFVASSIIGGDQVRVFDVSDPLGAGTVTLAFQTVTPYQSAPLIRQPNGAFLFPGIPKLGTAYLIRRHGDTLIFTGLTTGFGSGPEARARLLIMNTTRGNNLLDLDYGLPGWDYSSPTPVVNYRRTCVWLFQRSNPENAPELRYVSWEDGHLDTASLPLNKGSSSFGTPNLAHEWGTGFGGSLDWGDYAFQGGGSGNQKLWFYGQFPTSVDTWGTVAGATRSLGAVPGSVVATGEDYHLRGFVGGAFSPNQRSYQVTNPGDVGTLYEVSVPAWLSATPDGRSLYAGRSESVVVRPNSATNALPYGIHTGTVSIRDCLTGASTVWDTSVTVRRRVLPEALRVRLGRVDRGGLASLFRIDGDLLIVCRFFVPNLTVPPVVLEVDATLPDLPFSAVSFTLRSRMRNSGSYSQEIQFFDWASNSWSGEARRVDAIGTSVLERELEMPGPFERFVRPADRLVRARWRVSAVGPVGTPAWCYETDFANWNLTP